jgi:hypothetical protein
VVFCTVILALKHGVSSTGLIFIVISRSLFFHNNMDEKLKGVRMRIRRPKKEKVDEDTGFSY